MQRQVEFVVLPVSLEEGSFGDFAGVGGRVGARVRVAGRGVAFVDVEGGFGGWREVVDEAVDGALGVVGGRVGDICGLVWLLVWLLLLLLLGSRGCRSAGCGGNIPRWRG